MSMTISTESRCPVVIRRSAIHGRGLFANCTIAQETLIGCYDGPRTQRDGRYVLWIQEEDGTSYGVKGQNEFRFVNHSHTPNAVFRGEELYALRMIEPDEEITVHYGEDWTDM